jgi:hypothetical protein
MDYTDVVRAPEQWAVEPPRYSPPDYILNRSAPKSKQARPYASKPVV